LFERVEVYPYQRKQEQDKQDNDNRYPAGRGKNRRVKKIAGLRIKDVAGQVALLVAGFLLGRAVLLGELLPFGAAFVAAVFAVYREYALAALLGAVLGLVYVATGWNLALHIITLVAVAAAALSLPGRSRNARFLKGTVVFVILVLAGTGYAAVTGPTTYDYVRVLFESVFAGLLTAAYLGALEGLRQAAGHEPVAAEKVFCVALFLASLVAGAGQIRWGMMSPGGMLAGFVVITAGYVGGAGLGAAAGAVMGVLPGLVYSVAPAALGAFAFAGFLGGLARGLGRVGTVGGFMLANTLLTVYLGSSPGIISVLAETAGAALVFLLVPAAVLNGLKEYLPSMGLFVAAQRPAAGRNEMGVAGKIRRWGAVFEEISRAYDQVSGSLEPKQKCGDRRLIFSELQNMVCAGCALHRVCWERELLNTSRCLERCLEIVNNNGRVETEDLDDNLRRRCSRTGELVMGVNCLYRLHRMNRFWENRMQESRRLASEQLRGMHGVIEQLARGMEAESEPWHRLAEYYKQELKHSGVPVVSLALYPCPRGCEVEVNMPACGGGKKCVYDVAPLLSRLSGENLTPAGRDCLHMRKDDFCSFRLYPHLKFRLKLGVTGCAGKGSAVSGDSHAILPLNDGRLAIMLSDGMGSGPAAAAESRAALTLLQQMLQTGFGRDVAIRTINSLMMRRLPEDNFATVDMCVADLYAGKAELVKIGAPPSFLVRQNRVEVIRSNSLPVGIVDEINIFSVSRDIKGDDMLIMVTDGVIDAYRETGDGKEWISSVLGEIIDLPPQEVADLILRLAQSGAGEGRRPPDDMTVLVARVEEV